MITKGYAAPETMNASERAAALAEKSGDLAQLVSSFSLRATITVLSGELVVGRQLAAQALALAVREGSRNSRVNVEPMNLIANYWSGNFAEAEKHFTYASSLYQDPLIRQGHGNNPIAVFAYGSWNAWARGWPHLALKRQADMITGLDASQPYDLAWSGYYAAHLHLFMRDDARSAALAEQALELSVKHQFPYTDAASRCVLGHAQAQLGRPDEGAALIREGVAKLVERGARLLVGNFTTYLAAAQQRQGLPCEAFETVEHALQANPDILAYRPEMLRLRGELRLDLGQTEAAGCDFNEAVALAQKFGAKAWELRATLSLARILASQGRHKQARTMLAEIYNWFTEGFDTADLKDAKGLLDELSA
jgi:tetratricopeptide (TPR) repeat protein